MTNESKLWQFMTDEDLPDALRRKARVEITRERAKRTRVEARRGKKGKGQARRAERH